MTSVRIGAAFAAIALAATAAAPWALSAARAADPPHGATTGPVVVELFSSQSCYSCPPAEAFLVELAEEPDLIALEWHVDYWDRLVYGAAGAWRDPFSSRAHTNRQRRYNANITGRPRAYTPQMVVAGAQEAVGSNRAAVRSLIDAAQAAQATVAIVPEAGDQGPALGVTVSGGPAAEVWLARFRDRVVTEVPRGENHGKTLANVHVVQSFERLGRHREKDADAGSRFVIDAPAEGDGCAVVVQAPHQGPIYGAAYC